MPKISQEPDGTAIILDGTELWVGNSGGITYRFTTAQIMAGARRKRTITAAGAITVATTDQIILVAKTVAAATIINLPAAASFLSDELFIKDLNGVCATNNFTVTPNGAETIDGLTTYLMLDNYAHLYLGKKTNGWYVKGQM
jgi:hypothetical protein